MNISPNHSAPSTPILIRGIHLTLTPALEQAARSKTSHLLHFERRIDRIRVDLEHDRSHPGAPRFVARGRLELHGPDLVATVASEDAYKSLDLLVAKLDAQLRRRHGRRVRTRNDPRRDDDN